jgi:hypothetical protein
MKSLLLKLLLTKYDKSVRSTCMYNTSTLVISFSYYEQLISSVSENYCFTDSV